MLLPESASGEESIGTSPSIDLNSLLWGHIYMIYISSMDKDHVCVLRKPLNRLKEFRTDQYVRIENSYPI